MQDILNRVAQLKRPKLLVTAARSGAAHYARDRHSARLLPSQRPRKHAAILIKLMEMECDINDLRCAMAASYSPLQHLDVMIALVGETQLLRAAHQ